jgi:hypothetical protein
MFTEVMQQFSINPCNLLKIFTMNLESVFPQKYFGVVAVFSIKGFCESRSPDLVRAQKILRPLRQLPQIALHLALDDSKKLL